MALRQRQSLQLSSLLLLLCAYCRLTIVSGYIIIGNGPIYTVDDDDGSLLWANAIAIDPETGIILSVGTSVDDIYEKMGTTTESEKEKVEFWDLQGRLVLPGFQDVHLHAVEAGINQDLCYVDEFADLYDIVPFYLNDCPNQGRVTKTTTSNSNSNDIWIVAAGIDIAYLEETVWDFCYEYPIQVLDQHFPNTPVLILDNLGHGAVVNSKAMELVGLLNNRSNNGNLLIDDSDPPGGKIDRDPDNTSKPTGIVRENAQHIFRNAAFPPTTQNQDIAYQSLLGALGTLAANGITTVSDAGGFWKQSQTIDAWNRAESQGTLTVRASNAFYIYPDIPIQEQLDEFLLSHYSNDPNRLVRFNQAKIYVDGILSLTTAALKEPYETSLGLKGGSEYGFEYFGNQNTLNQISSTLIDAGFQLHFHVTGDRGAELALNAIAAAATTTTTTNNNNNDGSILYHRLTHCYLVDPEDYPRFQELNVVADFQLASSSLSRDYRNFISDFIGTDRVARLLPAKEIHQAGGLVTISSDWDADTLSPLKKIKTVLTTNRLNNNNNNEKVLPDLETAIRMMTINPAMLLQQESKTGTISVGKYADLVVLDQNIFEMTNANDIDDVNVVATIFQGRIIYDPDGIFGESLGTMPPDGATTIFATTFATNRTMFWVSVVCFHVMVSTSLWFLF